MYYHQSLKVGLQRFYRPSNGQAFSQKEQRFYLFIIILAYILSNVNCSTGPYVVEKSPNFETRIQTLNSVYSAYLENSFAITFSKQFTNFPQIIVGIAGLSGVLSEANYFQGYMSSRSVVNFVYYVKLSQNTMYKISYLAITTSQAFFYSKYKFILEQHSFSLSSTVKNYFDTQLNHGDLRNFNSIVNIRGYQSYDTIAGLSIQISSNIINSTVYAINCSYPEVALVSMQLDVNLLFYDLLKIKNIYNDFYTIDYQKVSVISDGTLLWENIGNYFIGITGVHFLTSVASIKYSWTFDSTLDQLTFIKFSDNIFKITFLKVNLGQKNCDFPNNFWIDNSYNGCISSCPQFNQSRTCISCVDNPNYFKCGINDTAWVEWSFILVIVIVLCILPFCLCIVCIIIITLLSSYIIRKKEQNKIQNLEKSKINRQQISMDIKELLPDLSI